MQGAMGNGWWTKHTYFIGFCFCLGFLGLLGFDPSPSAQFRHLTNSEMKCSTKHDSICHFPFLECRANSVMAAVSGAEEPKPYSHMVLSDRMGSSSGLPVRSHSVSVAVCILQLMRIIPGLCKLHPRCKFVCQGFAWPTNKWMNQGRSKSVSGWMNEWMGKWMDASKASELLNNFRLGDKPKEVNIPVF